jgi:hypothetical protein
MCLSKFRVFCIFAYFALKKIISLCFIYFDCFVFSKNIVRHNEGNDLLTQFKMRLPLCFLKLFVRLFADRGESEAVRQRAVSQRVWDSQYSLHIGFVFLLADLCQVFLYKKGKMRPFFIVCKLSVDVLNLILLVD